MNFLNQTRTAIISTLVVSVIVAGCHNFYKVTTPRAGTVDEASATVDSLKTANRYFILRNENDAFAMKNMILSADRQKITCELDVLPATHWVHIQRGTTNRTIYKRTSEAGINLLNEVHLYVFDNNAKLGSYELPLASVQKIELIEHDRKRTTNSYVIGALGYTLGAVVVVTAIAFALKSSCPFISGYVDSNFVLQGEIYGGAIYPQLARHDYLPLKLSPREDNTLQVKITNELKERQFTDLAELLVVSHDKDVIVMTDENGNLYSISNPLPPVSARLGNKEVRQALSKTGDYHILYLDDSSQATARNDVFMDFDKPVGATRAKLLLTLKNSYWLDLLYGELAKGIGAYYPKYIAQQKTRPAADLLRWVKEQQIPLEVSVKIGEQWQTVANLTTVGPLAHREMVVPIEFPAGKTLASVRLSSGFMFWEIDYAAIDYSSDSQLDIERLLPIAATDQTGKKVRTALLREDGVFLEQPEIGDAATLVYKPSRKGDTKTRSYFFHAKGYYEHIRDFKNPPDLKFLAQFRQPNGFPVFGMELYRKIAAHSFESTATTQIR